jgi:hypothetical protein
MAQMLLLCGEDNAPTLLIDIATNKVTRYSQGLLFTDDVGHIYSDGDYIWAADLDSSIVCWTKDLVDLAHLDAGYYAQTQRGRWNSFHIDGNFLYVLNTRQHDGETYVYDQTDELQLTIRKFNKVTLQFVSEVVLSAVEFWDDTNKIALLDTNTYFWVGTFLWIKDQSGTWYKINVNTGVVVDTWTPGDGAPSWTPAWANTDGTKVLADISWNNSSVDYADFTTKTVGSTSINLQQAAVDASKFSVDAFVTANNLLTTSGIHPLVDETTNKIYFLINTSDNAAWAKEHYFMVSLNWVTGATTFSDGIEMSVDSPDNAKLPLGAAPTVFTFMGNYIVINPTKAFAWTTSAGAMIDFQAGAMDGIIVGSMQGYAGNGTYLRPAQIIDIPAILISGTVTSNGAPVHDQKVFLYDQATGQKMDETLTDSGGAYQFIKYTNRSYFVVCSAPNMNANFKIKSQL